MVLSLCSSFVLLTSICFLNTDNYFGYHGPSALSKQFESLYQLSDSQFGALFTIYSLPNIVFVFFSGIIIDKYGAKVASLVFNLLISTGLFICAFTPYPSKDSDTDDGSVSFRYSYSLLLCGRFLLGLGGESVVACASTMIAKWFSKGYLNTAMSINQAVVQFFGSAASFYILPRLSSLYTAQIFTAYVSVFSILANMVYWYLEDKFYDDMIQKANMQEYVNIPASESEQNYDNHYESVSYQNALAIEVNILNDIDRNSFSISDILNRFTIPFWLLLCHVGCLSPILYTFTAFGSLYLLDNFPSVQSAEEAGTIISLLYVGIGISPFSGYIIDRIGHHRILIQLLATCNILLIFLILIYCPDVNPYFCFSYLGFLFSITESNYLALIACIVPDDLIGTAYGLFGCMISIALLIEPATVGYLRQSSGSFAQSVWMFVFLISISMILCLALFIYNKKYQLQI